MKHSCFPAGASGKELTCQCRRHKRCRFDPWARKIPWRRKWQPTPVFWPGESHGKRSLAGLQSTGSQRVRHDSDGHFHFHCRFPVVNPRFALLVCGSLSVLEEEFICTFYFLDSADKRFLMISVFLCLPYFT